jgi:cephalosporin hydroxylase
MNHSKLFQIFKSHKGKVLYKWSSYINVYNNYFLKYQKNKISLLEIGVQNGGSLEVWAKYFTKAKYIIGCDIDKKCGGLKFTDKRIAIFVGDVNRPQTYNKIYNKSSSFDIIIDDGSHKSFDIIQSFLLYFPLLKHGGVYIIEDLHCSYWEEYDGGLYNPHSSISFFKNLLDIINYDHWGLNIERRKILQDLTQNMKIRFDEKTLAEIYSVEFFNSMCIFRKEKKSACSLGRAFISGEDELVTNGLIKNLKNSMPIFLQENNHFSNLNMSLSRSQKNLDLKSHELELKSHELELKSHELELKSHELELRKQELSHIYNSRGWKLIKILRLIFFSWKRLKFTKNSL